MVSRRVDPSARRRCINACDKCKRRKERCDGLQPCRRCKERGVGCYFNVEASPRRTRTRAAVSRGPSQPAFISTDGNQGDDVSDAIIAVGQDAKDTEATQPSATAQSSESLNNIELDYCRFIQDKKGRYMFIGDSANLSFLHSVRCVASDALGSCPVVDDPLRSSMVEATPDASTKRIGIPSDADVPELSLDEAASLVHQFFAVTDGFVDLFVEAEIIAALPSLLSRSELITAPTRAAIYLVLAIGAQSQSDLGKIADEYFNHGRDLIAQYLTEDVSIQSAQLSLLVSVYLLGASRRNAAFVCLGQAVRSGYALGIHQRANQALFSASESRERERLWRSLRMIDLFTSASLGRPPSTAEPKTSSARTSSPTDELYAILETILTEVYGERKITTGILAKVSSRQRKWAAKFARIAPIPGSNEGEYARDCSSIGPMHLKQTYYWTIMLLTRPFLVDRVTAHAKAIAQKPKQPIQACVLLEPTKTLIHACVDSAIKTVSLLEPLLTAEVIPRHLPLLINAAFHAALVLGFSYFGDLYMVFPLESALRKSHEVLRLFPHDSIAMRYEAITQYLRDTCSAYFEKRHATSMDMESEAIGQLFGQIHGTCPEKRHSKAIESDGTSHFADRWSSRGPTHAQALSSAASSGPTGTNSAETLDTFMFSSPETCSEAELLARLDMQADLNLEFPLTTQHVWIDSNDLPTFFADMDMHDSGVAFLEQ